jgi:hypothetical protein
MKNLSLATLNPLQRPCPVGAPRNIQRGRPNHKMPQFYDGKVDEELVPMDSDRMKLREGT